MPNSPKYNIALLATGHPEAYVEVATHYFSRNAQGYLLGPYNLPHITICQFFAEKSTLSALIKELGTENKVPPIYFTGFGFSKHRGDDPAIWWAELSVTRSPDLLTLQTHIVSILEEHHLIPLNSVGDLYRPHLTLARTQGIDIRDLSAEILAPEQFKLVLGEADDFGQFTKVLHAF